MIGRRMGNLWTTGFSFSHSFADGMGDFTQVYGTSAINASNQIYPTGYDADSFKNGSSIELSFGITHTLSGDFTIILSGLWDPVVTSALCKFAFNLRNNIVDSLVLSMSDSWANDKHFLVSIGINGASTGFGYRTTSANNITISRTNGVITWKFNGTAFGTVNNADTITFDNIYITLGTKYTTYAVDITRLGSISIEE